MVKMNKLEALLELMREARRDRASPTSYRRMLRVCRALELNAEDQKVILGYLDYVDRVSGEPHPWLARLLESE